MFPSGTIRGKSIQAMSSRQIAAIFQYLVNKGYSTNKEYAAKKKQSVFRLRRYSKRTCEQIPGQFCLFDMAYDPLI